MAEFAYRDGAVHEREELEAERERLMEEDELEAAGTEALAAELEELRLRVRGPITSSVDAAERREALAAYDTAIDAAKIARGQRRSRRRVRIVLASIVSTVMISGAASIASARRVDAPDASGSCRTSWMCREKGRCVQAFSTLIGVTSVADDEGCVARAPSHCAQACKDYGLCELGDGECIARSHTACEASEACFWHGRCAKVGDACAPATAEHCEESVICAWRDQCVLSESSCVKP